MAFEELLIQKTEEVEKVIRNFLPVEEGLQKTILISSNYSVENGGKRLRPLIMKETFRLFSGTSPVIEPFMAAIEFIHSSSLVHDDLPCMDNDTMRRGKPSTWYKFGEDMGVLSGDALMVYAFETAAKAFSYHQNTEAVGQAMGVLANKAGIYGMIGGQTVDVEKTGKPLSEEELDFIYRLKTGALIEASMMCGAILAGASKEDIVTVEKIAGNIGYAFQIQDDILDLTASEETLGKPVHSDERNEKTTYVTLHGLEASKEEVKRLTEEAIASFDDLTGENAFLVELLKSLIERDK